ncbi:hypothetical protein LG634_08305 [Streptomyces bambusae]|uniref:hypothetical protein n=1 Tax=Streptomyces bambusae TaxID=1550616 RepID=UPI001CFC5E72|nr:hypothetical protein [Streptomyces bambusae]MCB5164833.1 hypothetical protein [Streptomyces bambusae]
MRRRTATLLLTATLLSPTAAHAAAGDFAPLEVTPRSAAPGDTVTVDTTACGRAGTADGDATTVGGGRFRLAPGAGEAVAGSFRIAPGTPAGTYGIGVTCANGRFATGDIAVTGPDPQGHVQSGVGGGVQETSDPVLISAGVALLAAAAVGGTWILRRRASGAQV